MSRIAQLLDLPEAQVTKAISQLEDKNGYPSHDVRYLAQNLQQIRLKLADLGLDPNDTTAEELYHALLVKFEKDSQQFDSYFGADNLNFDQKLTKVAEVISQTFEMPSRWSLKKATAKKVLRAQPPKKAMKHLGYRSLESILKRERLAEIYLGAQYLESASWHKLHARQISKLDQTDFELRPIKLLNLTTQRWEDIQGPKDYLVLNDDIGAMALWPDSDLKKAPLLTMSILIIEKLTDYQELKLSSSLAKISQIVEWWVKTDHLIANLADEPVSLSIKDNALNSLESNHYDQRVLEHGRSSFWRELVGCYDNLPAIDGIFDSSIKDKIAKLKFDVPEAAYEYVEDI